MTEELLPFQIIERMVKDRRSSSDEEILHELSSLPPLADESDKLWEGEDYWNQVAYPYLALADVAAERRLRPAIGLLLERASFGDPGEIMRGLRHNLEAIANPDWDILADECLQAAQSKRPGTRLWAINELAILGDARAKPVCEAAIAEGPDELRQAAELALERLKRKQ